MALLYFLVACFSANAVMAKQCNFGDSQIDYLDTDQGLGINNSLIVPRALVRSIRTTRNGKTYSHFKDNFQGTGVKHNEVAYYSAIRNGKEVSYVGTVSMKDDGSFHYIGKEKNLNGLYKVLNTDYDCYAIIRGCPKKGPVQTLTLVQYRSMTPTAECEQAAQDGMKAVGIDSTKFVRQTYP